MKRILLMVITNIIHVPWWFYQIDKMGKHPNQYGEEERYHYLRKRLRRIIRRGRVKVVTYGVENLPKTNGFILFPNHQGLFDMLAIIQSCQKPLGVVIKKRSVGMVFSKTGNQTLGRNPNGPIRCERFYGDYKANGSSGKKGKKFRYFS